VQHNPAQWQRLGKIKLVIKKNKISPFWGYFLSKVAYIFVAEIFFFQIIQIN
jgi:hypothetical protein